MQMCTMREGGVMPGLRLLSFSRSSVGRCSEECTPGKLFHARSEAQSKVAAPESSSELGYNDCFAWPQQSMEGHLHRSVEVEHPQAMSSQVVWHILTASSQPTAHNRDLPQPSDWLTWEQYNEPVGLEDDQHQHVASCEESTTATGPKRQCGSCRSISTSSGDSS
eukprot:4251429-Amphidinium_carterae.1